MKSSRKRYLLVAAVAFAMGMAMHNTEAYSAQEKAEVPTNTTGPGMMGGQHGPGMMGGQHGPGMMGGPHGPGMMGGPHGPGMMGGQHGPGMMGGQRQGQNMMGHRGPGMMPMMDPVMVGRNSAMAERTLHLLKGMLVITKEQEAAWQAYVTSAMELALAHGGVMDIMRGSYATALAAAEARAVFMEKLVAKGKIVLESFKTLYGALSDEQKTKVDLFFGVNPGQKSPR